MNSADIFYSFPRIIDLSLERMRVALSLINLNLPPIIHIAGTNGKGSILSFLRAILESAGKKCHVYTSPHLVTIHERYVIAGEQISEDALFIIAKQVQEIAKNIPLTIFEAETLAGFIAFSQTPADYLLLETGLGGRLDATNAINDKLLTIISPIDYDHKEFLGEDLAQIAREKCGILRKNTAVIIARQQDIALEAIVTEAEKIHAPTQIFGQDWDSYQSFGNLCFQTHDQMLDLPKPSLQGEHQYENAGAAIMAALNIGISHDAIANGIKTAKWPARLQPINFGKFGKLANENSCELWLDGGHNPHGARACANFISQLQENDPKELVLICGLLANKDAKGFFKAFEKLELRGIICVPINSTPNSADIVELANLAEDMGYKSYAFEGLESAIKSAFLQPFRRVIICGSLYLAGEVLAKN